MMNLTESSSVFEPSLQPVFAKSANKAGQLTVKNSRDLFYGLIHISENYALLPRVHHFIKLQLQNIASHYSAQFSKKYSANQLQQLLNQANADAVPELTDADLGDFLQQYAPVFLTELSWLASITQTATSNTPLAVDLMAMYIRLTSENQSISNSRQIYLGLALSAGTKLPDVHTQAFAQHTEIRPEMFDFAAIQLGFGQFPRVFFPEILGFTLSYCCSQNLAEQFCAENKNLTECFKHRRQRHRQEIPNLTAIIHAYLAEHSEQNEALWQRIQCGFWLHHIQARLCCQHIYTVLQTVLSPRQAMHKLMLSLAPHAIGNHSKIRIGAKTIDEWFKEQPLHSETFLATLLHTPYVDRAKPENSKLLKLFEFNGPMFGVLNDDTKEIIKNWLLAELDPEVLQRKKDISSTIRSRSHKYGLQKITQAPSKMEGLFDFPADSISNAINFTSVSNKDLYYYLVNNEIYSAVLAVAKQHVSRWLTWTKWLTRLPLKPYTHANFENYIYKIFQHEADSYKPLLTAPKLGKNAYIWGIEQFAPTILADGCWLQGCFQLDFSPNASIGKLLQKIYIDEAGNGKFAQNHPQIYQQLLDSLDIKLPPITTKEFINHSGFIEQAFDIPVFLMSISKFTSAFLPELLGVNMAIELSGLGKVYPRLSEELKYYGINPAIIDIHTSIDNLATGHSALAIQAIQVYLDDVLTSHGEAEVQAHWRRIYTGFCALNFVGRRFKGALVKNHVAQQRQTA